MQERGRFNLFWLKLANPKNWTTLTQVDVSQGDDQISCTLMRLMVKSVLFPVSMSQSRQKFGRFKQALRIVA